MLQITIPKTELWDSAKEEFVNLNECTIVLEHSLVAISKWESKWHKPFLGKKTPKTNDEIRDYIKCMTVTQNVNPLAYSCLTKKNYEDIIAYIDDPMTATTFGESKEKKKRERIITSELIYYWMIQAGVPFECQKWHINRLLTLIHVCSEESKGAMPDRKRQSKGKIASDYASLNAARLKAMRTKG